MVSESALYRLAKLDRHLYQLSLMRWLLRSFVVTFLLSALVQPLDSPLSSLLFGAFFIILPFEVGIDLFRLFIYQQVKHAETAKNATLSYDTALLLVRYGATPARLWYGLVHDPSVVFVVTHLGITPAQITEQIVLPVSVQSWLQDARDMAKLEGRKLSNEHLLRVLLLTTKTTQWLGNQGISLTEVGDVWQWWERLEIASRERKRTLVDTLRFSGGIGRDWTSGYTRYLDAFAHDLTKELERYGASISLVGHGREKQALLEHLNRDAQHNVILVGDEGVGKMRLLLSLAADFVTGEVPVSLKYKHLYLLDVGRLMSGVSQEQLEQRLRALLEEAATVGNIILAIPDLHLLVGSQSNSLGRVDASGVLATYLESSALQLIAITTPESYYAYVKPNAALAPHVNTVMLQEISGAETLTILQDEAGHYEYKLRKVISYRALVKIVSIAQQHIHDQPFPEKALRLLESTAAHMGSVRGAIITASDVEQVASRELNIPLGIASSSERAILANLEARMAERIVGQHEAIRVVANALRRARAGLQSGARPVGSFLFLGPTGVGKTEMAKTIASLYFKNAKAFIRIDMTEYQTPESMNKLIGTKTSPGLLTTAVTDQPFSVVLLDEIEKAHSSIQNLFLQILDDGRVTDGFGKRVDFTHTMVIATSNAGAELIRSAVHAGQVDAGFKNRLLATLQEQGTFAPEWINRFDAVVVFTPLTEEEIRKIAQLQVADLVKRVRANNIELTIADDVYDYLVAHGYDPQYGARPMRRAVQDTIETALATQLLHITDPGLKRITVTRAMLEG